MYMRNRVETENASHSGLLSDRLAGMSFFCAVLIVMMHVGTAATPGTIQWWVFRFMGNCGLLRIAVPFFFLAAGYFLAKHLDEAGWYRRALKSRVKSLVVPYVLWNILYWVFCLMLIKALGWIGYVPASLNAETVRNANVLEVLGFGLFIHPMLGPTWFIRNLLVLIVLSPLVILAVRYLRFGMIFLLFLVNEICFYYVVGHPNMVQFILYTFSVEGLLYFAVGIFLREHPIVLPCGKGIGWCAFGCGLGMIGVSGILEELGIRQWTMVLWGCFIPLIMYGIWRLVPLEGLGRKMRHYAFPLYLIHFPVNVMLSGVVGMLGMKELARASIWFFVCRVTMVIVFSLVLARLLRMSRGCTALLFGGR